MKQLPRLVMALAVAIGSMISPAAVAAQGTASTVAVVAFNVRGARADTTAEYAGIGSAIADLLAADLRSAAGVRVVDRGPIGRTVALQAKTRQGFVGREGAVAAAKLLDAGHVVFGGFAADPAGNVRIDARAVNVGTGVVETTERLQGRGDDIVSLIHQLATRLAGAMTLPAGTSPSVTGVPLAALAAYGRALEAGDRGERAQARQLLEGVVRDHPDFAPARTALAAAGAS
jgi:TolB-like protein